MNNDLYNTGTYGKVLEEQKISFKENNVIYLKNEDDKVIIDKHQENENSIGLTWGDLKGISWDDLRNISKSGESISWSEIGDDYKNRHAEKSNKEVSVKMDDNKSFEREFNSINQNISNMENRLREDRIESEKRIEEQRKLSESRIEKRFDQVIEYHIQSEKRMNEKYDAAMEAIEYQNEKIDKLSDKIESNAKELRNISVTTIWSMIGIVAAIAALVLTVVLTIK